MYAFTEPVRTGIGAVCVEYGRPRWLITMLNHTHIHTNTCTECFVFLFLAPHARTTRYEEAFFPWKTEKKKNASLARLIINAFHLWERACVLNFAHAPTRRRGHGRGRPRRRSGQAGERKPHEDEARREVDTRARNAENRGNAGLSCDRMLAPRASEYPTYISSEASF